MEQISIAGVIVANRFRRDMGDMEQLKASMTNLGLLQPIGIDKDRSLVFGGRRLEAAKQLGWQTIAAKVVDCDALIAEHDENEMRKAFTVTERVAIAEAVAERLKKDAEIRMKAGKAPSGNISGGSEQGEARDLAAAKAGLGSGKTLEAAQSVVAKGVPALVRAMDDGVVTIHAAKDIATLPPAEQDALDYRSAQQLKTARNRAASRLMRAKEKAEPSAANKPEEPPKPDEARLYEPDSSLSALVLSHRAKTAISQISKNDPNALQCIENIRCALDKQLKLITTKDAQ